eukprot:754829-Hanusia_phi.AAC.1
MAAAKVTAEEEEEATSSWWRQMKEEEAASQKLSKRIESLLDKISLLEQKNEALLAQQSDGK